MIVDEVGQVLDLIEQLIKQNLYYASSDSIQPLLLLFWTPSITISKFPPHILQMVINVYDKFDIKLLLIYIFF